MPRCSVGRRCGIGRGALPWSARVCNVLQLVVVRRLQGRLAEMEGAAREAAEEYASSYPVCKCAHIHVLAAVGDEAEARVGTRGARAATASARSTSTRPGWPRSRSSPRRHTRLATRSMPQTLYERLASL